MICVAEYADRRDVAPISRHLPEHEKLVYEVRWLGFPIGSATASINGIKEINGRPAYKIEITAKTNDFCSSIYKVEDRYVSYLDVEGLYTVRHEVYRRDGSYRKDAVTDFDQIKHKAYFKNLLDRSEKVIDVPFGTQDPVSMIYYFRLVPIEEGRRKEFFVYNNESVYQLYGDIGRKESVRIPHLGMREAFKVHPYAILNGAIVKKGKARIYFSCDDKQIPIKAVAKGPIFTSVAGYFVKSE
jgi:hypothetical protein